MHLLVGNGGEGILDGRETVGDDTRHELRLRQVAEEESAREAGSGGRSHSEPVVEPRDSLGVASPERVQPASNHVSPCTVVGELLLGNELAAALGVLERPVEFPHLRLDHGGPLQ